MTLAERKKDTMTMSDGGFVVAVLIANEFISTGVHFVRFI